ncbi:MAG: biotin-dependent carboxyltransferase family protein [Treponema sp.]|uniref:5-oxoprolinase subunit C family protein n=1 Tax=Treponema sp. TaxID=166 RepID=UPI003FA1E3DB
MKCSIKVIRPGVCTTIQDLGRIGYQKFGIPVAGVMDEFAASVANFLVGNERNEAVLEITYLGPTLAFQKEMLIGIAGADVSPKLNGTPVPVWESFTVTKDDVLSFGSVKSGVRAYIAFAGSIDVPPVNGSKSTLMKSKIGGFQGRMLQAGDELAICVRHGSVPQRLPARFIPVYPHSNDISVCLGPQDDYFTEQGIADFFRQPYTITANADRMGIRLDGAAVAHKTKADIISDAAVIGSIQVPADGKPIILMADRQTTGGYAKIGTVIKEDIIKLAQMASKDTVQFCRISMEDAQQKYRAFYQKLEEIQKTLQDSRTTKMQSHTSLRDRLRHLVRRR